MNLDFKKFKKIETTDTSTTLQHPDGHRIKIAHKGLKPEHKKELEALPGSDYYAKGGKITYKEFMAKNPSEPSKASKSTNTMPGSPTEAKDNYTEPNAMGTEIPKDSLKQEMASQHQPDVVVNALNKKAPPFGPLGAEAKYHSPPCINPSCKSYGSSHPNCRCYGGKMGMYGGYAEGGEVKKEYYCDSNRPHFKGCEYLAEGGEAEAPVDTGINVDPSSAPAAAPQQFNMTAPENIQQPQEANINPNPEVGGNDAAEPAPDEAQQSPDQSQAPATPAEQVMNQKQQNLLEMHPEAQAFQADLDNGHIQPKTYADLFHDKGTLGKIGTIFGLLLSSAGAGLSHQPNMLLAMMNKQIDNDLNAQQQSQTNKQNYLKINQQNILNKAQASNLTADARTKAYALSKVQMNLAALHSLVQNTQKLPEGPQKQQAMQTLAMMNQGVQNENFNIMDRAATAGALSSYLTGGQGGGQNTTMMKSGLLGPEAREVGADVENKTMPGIPGKASVPLSGADREQIGSGMAFDKRLDNFINWTKTHSGSLNPKDIQYGKALAAQIQQGYREATNGGVYKEGEQNFISKIITDKPTEFFNKVRAIPQLQAVQGDLRMRLDSNLKNKGFQGYPGAQKQAQSSQAQSKSGRPIVYKNGKAYYQ